MKNTITKPRIVAFEVTRKCRLNCIHCRAVASPEETEGLTTTQCKKKSLFPWRIDDFRIRLEGQKS